MYNPNKDEATGLTAVSCHSFAGAFTLGVRDAGFKVDLQLEHLGFGYDTARKLNSGIEIVHGFENWPEVQADFLFGNPRCNSFSPLSSVAKDEGRGCWGYQTQDIHQLCEYGVRNKIPFIGWESVQMAFNAGRPLHKYLIDNLFRPAGYRIAHILMNSASHRNAQCRRRYFFMAYSADYPELSIPVHPVDEAPEYTPLFIERYYKARGLDASNHLVESYNYLSDEPYGPDHYMDLTDDEWFALPHLKAGESLNTLAQRATKERNWSMLTRNQRARWIERKSDIPFSLHAIKRPREDWYLPTIYTGTKRLVHLYEDRPMTFGEIAAAMGWPPGVVPVGRLPVEQIAKGVVPSCARWFADIVKATIANKPTDMPPNTTFDALYENMNPRPLNSSKLKALQDDRYYSDIESVYDLTWWIPGRSGVIHED